MTFRVGQKVVCIDDYSSLSGRYCLNMPKLHGVYTVRNFEGRGDIPALRLFELINEPRTHRNVPGLIEPAFDILSFRPVVDRPTDISIFTKMLNPNQESVS